MSKLILTLSVMLSATFFKAQSDVYFKLRKAIELSHPEITLSNKLIAYSIWSLEDAESREAGKGFEKAYQVYEYARLKGGLQGIVVVVVNKDHLSGTAVITLHKDGIIKSISLSPEEAGGIGSLKDKNAVFDSNGSEVYKNLPASAVFSSIHQLITR